MKITTIIASTVISVLVTACSSSGSSEGGDAELNGSWTLPCGTDGNTSIDTILVINGTSFTRTVREYLFDSNCNPNSGILNTNIIGSISFPSGTTPSADGDLKQLDITFTNANYTANSVFQTQIASEGTTLQATMLSARGIEDINNVPITNFTPQANSYTVYRVDGATLYTGEDDGAGNDGTTVAQRHTRLDTIRVYTKQ